MPLHNDDDNEEVGNYREIALVCSVEKVFVKVLARGFKALLRIGF